MAESRRAFANQVQARRFAENLLLSGSVLVHPSLKDKSKDDLNEMLFPSDPALPQGRPKRPGRKGHGIEHYLRWAILYSEKAGDRAPLRRLAEEHLEELGGDLDKAQVWVRDTVTTARRRYGLLSAPPGPGRAGGELTAKARQLIKERTKGAGR